MSATLEVGSEPSSEDGEAGGLLTRTVAECFTPPEECFLKD